MTGSSGLGWEKSDSSRGLNGCVISRERIGLHNNGNILTGSGNASNNDRFMQGGKARETDSSRSHLMEQSDLSLRQWLNKKIKVFECDSILSEDRDIHYPVVEMASKSKISSLCFNSYIKSQIASSDFEGVVQVWDVTQSQVIMEMREHERRVWSVDLSLADPTKLASGSDDCAVKLWNINQVGSIGTIGSINICGCKNHRYVAGLYQFSALVDLMLGM